MLLIPCPYCGDAPGDRVPLWRRGAYRAAGRSGRARLTRSGRSISTCAAIRKALHAERWRHMHGCGRFFNALRDTVSDRILATYRSASRGRSARSRRSRAMSAFRIAGGGRIDRAQAAALHLRRPRYDGFRGRHAGLGAARERRASRRPLVQVSPAARHLSAGRRSRMRWSTVDRDDARRDAEPARDAGRALRRPAARQPEPLAVARASTSAPSNDLLSPLLSGGLLLQDLHVAARLLEAPLRAGIRAPPASGARPTRPIPIATRSATRIATCWSSAPGRPGSPRRLRRPRAARVSSSATSRRSSAARCWLHDDATIDGKPARDWLADAVASSAHAANVTLLPRTTAFGYYPHNLSVSPSA